MSNSLIAVFVSLVIGIMIGSYFTYKGAMVDCKVLYKEKIEDKQSNF